MNKKIIPLVLIIFFLFVLLSGCTEQQTHAITIFYVNAQGGYDYLTIQQAIENASDGYTIIVYRGTYAEELFINKTLIIKAYEKENTILQPKNTNQNSIITLNADHSIISDFIIQATSDTIGIDITASYTTISNNTISNTKTAVNVKRNMYYTTIYNNTFINNQQGVYTYFSYHNNISYNSFILDQTASYLLSYAIYIHNSESDIVSHNNITNYNQAIRIKGTDNALVFNNNLRKNKVGIYCCCGASQTMIYTNNFMQNELHAKDDVFNQWDNGMLGNYWDDYLTQNPDGQPTNGIYDQPYLIYYWRNQEPLYPKQDRYPLVNPVV